MSRLDVETHGMARIERDLERQALGLLVGAGSLIGGLALLVAFLLAGLVVVIGTSVTGLTGGVPAVGRLPGPPPAAIQRNEIASEQLPPMPDVSAAGLIPGWATRPALDQYACGNYRSVSDCRIWSPAACSAAALDWLLGAYGVRLGGIDDAVRLIGAGTGISAMVGLLDANGTRLAAAEAAVGLRARRAQLRSSGDLRAWLRQGPLMLDGRAWFGVGHWFVAIGSDAGGIFTRDSSGRDTRYLSWARLYGEVGWSGWAVGVQAADGGPSA